MSLLLRTTRSGRFINFNNFNQTNLTNLGAQKGKNLRTPHSVVTAPNTTYKDKFTVLVHKSQGLLAFAGGDSGEFCDVCPCFAENGIVLGP